MTVFRILSLRMMFGKNCVTSLTVHIRLNRLIRTLITGSTKLYLRNLVSILMVVVTPMSLIHMIKLITSLRDNISC
jgi:hypothetical protein